MYVTFFNIFYKTVIDDDADERGVTGGELFQVFFPGGARQVRVDAVVEILVAVTEKRVAPEWGAVDVYGPHVASANVLRVDEELEILCEQVLADILLEVWNLHGFLCGCFFGFGICGLCAPAPFAADISFWGLLGLRKGGLRTGEQQAGRDEELPDTKLIFRHISSRVQCMLALAE